MLLLLFNVKTFDWITEPIWQNVFCFYLCSPAVMLKKETPYEIICAPAKHDFDQDNKWDRQNVIYQNMLTAVMSINVTPQQSVMFQSSYTADKSAVITVHWIIRAATVRERGCVLHVGWQTQSTAAPGNKHVYTGKTKFGGYFFGHSVNQLIACLLLLSAYYSAQQNAYQENCSLTSLFASSAVAEILWERNERKWPVLVLWKNTEKGERGGGESCTGCLWMHFCFIMN